MTLNKDFPQGYYDEMAQGFVPKLLHFFKTYPHELFTVVFFCFLYAFVPRESVDGGWWVEWARLMRVWGFNNIYAQQDSMVNYLPGTLYFIEIWQYALGILHIPLWLRSAYTFKVFPMFFDALTVILCFRLAKKFKLPAVAVYIGLLFNVAFQFNSYIWGQVDSVYTFFVFLSLYFLSEKKNFWGLATFMIALNFKIQALVMLPIIVMACVLNFFASDRDRCGKSEFLKGLILLELAQVLIFVPFSSSPREILQIIWEKGVNMGSYVTWNAYNFWMLVGAISLKTRSYDPWLGGLSYTLWGYFLFCIASALSLFPYALLTLEVISAKLVKKNSERVQKLSAWLRTSQSWLLSSLTAYLVSLSFFFFLSDMHERYSHPTVLFSFLIGIFSKNYWILVLTSIAYFLNLNETMGFFGMPVALSGQLQQPVAILYLVAFGLALQMLYRSTLKNLAWLHS